MICQNDGIMKKKWKVKIIIYNIFTYIFVRRVGNEKTGNLLIVICQV